MVLLGIFVYTFLFGHLFSAHLSISLEVALLGHQVTLRFNFMRNHQTLFQSSCIILHSHQQHRRVPVSPHPCQYLFSIFLTITILAHIDWYLTVMPEGYMLGTVGQV